MNKLNLIESFLAVVLIPNMTTAQVCRDLSEEIGHKYTPQDFGKWRRGARPIPQPVADYMMQCAIGHALRSEGVNVIKLNDDALDRILARLTPPERAWRESIK
jgi:hypothetical protein